MATRPAKTLVQRIERLERDLPHAPQLGDLIEDRVQRRVFESHDDKLLAVLQAAMLAEIEDPSLSDDGAALARVVAAKVVPVRRERITEEDVRNVLALIGLWRLEEYEKIIESVRGSHGQRA